MKAEPPPALWAVVAFESDSGVQGAIGYERGSHMAIESHGAGVSSNQCETSWPGCEFVGSARGSTPSVRFQLTLLPDPGAFERNVASGSSWPMY
jgi:hypothetical protein